MLANYDWRLRHAGLMAIAAIAEGTSKVRLAYLWHSLGPLIRLLLGDANGTREGC